MRSLAVGKLERDEMFSVRVIDGSPPRLKQAGARFALFLPLSTTSTGTLPVAPVPYVCTVELRLPSFLARHSPAYIALSLSLSLSFSLSTVQAYRRRLTLVLCRFAPSNQSN